MAEPIVRSFVIDTTQAEQNLQRLDVVTTATNASLDGLYNQLISLDAQLQKLDPNSQAFAEVNTQIQQLETTITGIETGKIDDIGKAIESIDAGNAAQSIEQVGNAVEQVVAPVNNLANATDQLNAELKETKVDTSSIETASADFQELAVEQEQVTTSSKSLKAQLRELQAQLAATDPDSAKYRELAIAAGELKDQISDAAEAVGTQAGSAFERVSGSLGLVTGRLASLDFAGAAEGAKLFATNLAAVKPADLANGIKSVGSAFVSVGRALLTNPLFLLGSAVVLIITNLDKLANVIPGVGAALEAIGNVVSFIVDGIKSLTDSIAGTSFVANDVLNKSIEQRERAIKELDAQEKRALAQARKNGESITEVEEKYAQERINKYKAIVDNAAILTARGVKLTEEQVKAVQDANDALFDIETQQLQKAAELAEKARQEEQRKEQEASAKRQENARKRADEEKARKQKELDDQRNALQSYYNGVAALEDEQYEKTLTQNEREELAIQKKYENLFALADAAKKDTTELQQQLNAELLALQERQAQDEIAKEVEKERLKNEARIKATQEYYEQLAAFEDENFQNTLTDQEKEELAVTQKYEKLFAAADAAGISTKDLQTKLGEELLGIQKKFEDAGVEQFKTAEEAKRQEQLETINQGLEWAEKGLNAISALNDVAFANKMSKVKKGSKEEEALAKKQFKFQKALQIGAATIDAAKSVTASLAAAPVAIGPVPNPAGIASLALAITTGTASIAKIAATKFEGGGGGNLDVPSPSVGGGGDTGSQPAQFNPLASSFLQDRPDQLTPRAYVLSGDVASQQEVRTKVEDLARIG